MKNPVWSVFGPLCVGVLAVVCLNGCAARDGKFLLRPVALTRAPGEKTAQWTRSVPVQGDREYQLSLRYRIGKGFAGKAEVTVEGCGVSHAACSVRLPFPGEAISWQTLDFTFVPKETGAAVVGLKNFGTGTVLFDHLKVEEAVPYEMTNMIRNGGFETTRADGLPAAGWWTYPTTIAPEKALVSVDAETAHTGASALRIEVKDRQYVGVISPPRRVNPGDRLYISGYYKSNLKPFVLDEEALKKMAGKAHPSTKQPLATLTLGYRDLLGHSSYGGSKSKQMTLNPVAGEWQKVEGTFTAPENVIHLETQITLSECLGQFRFDDLVVKKLNPYSLNLAPYSEQVCLGENTLKVKVENYQNAIEDLVLALSLDDKPVTRMPFTLSGAKVETVSVAYNTEQPGMHKARVSLLRKHDKEPLFVAEKRIEVATIFEPSLVYPTYVWPEESITEVVERIKINLPKAQRENCRLKVAVLKDGESLREDVETLVREEFQYTYRLNDAEPGDYVMAISLLDEHGKEMATGREVFHVMDHAKPVVKIVNRNIYIDGKPFFPIGMYQAGRWDQYAKAGFNFVHRYGFEGNFDHERNLLSTRDAMKTLDRLKEHGLWTLMSTPRFRFSSGDFDSLRARFRALQSHPMILGYYEEEQMIHGMVSYEDGKRWHDLIRQVDPGRLIAIADWVKDKDGKKRFPEELCDIGIHYWYPFPLPKGQTELIIPDWFKEIDKTDRIMWVAPQSNRRHWMSKDMQGWPRPEDYRLQAYLSIVHGCRGLLYFGGHIFSEPEAGNWTYLQKLAAELRDMSPVFTSPTSKLKVAVSGSDKIDHDLKEHGGVFYLIAAYRDVPAASATFSLPFKPASINVRYENRQITPDGSSFRDTFEEYAVHIYEVRTR